MVEELVFEHRRTAYTRSEVPLFVGEVPPARKSLAGVTLDGEPVIFDDPSVPDRLHRTLVDGSQFEDFDCTVFALLMAGYDISKYVGTGMFTYQPNHRSVDQAEGIQSGDLVSVGRYLEEGLGPAFMHAVYAAPNSSKFPYLHKASGRGPVCLSTLEDAQTMCPNYGRRAAAVVTSFALAVDGQLAFQSPDLTHPAQS